MKKGDELTPQVIAADSLRAVDKTPFNNMWKDKKVRTEKKRVKVPKNFYQNYRKNMVADASEIA